MGAGRQEIARHVLVLVLVVAVLQACSAARDPNLTLLTLPDIVGVWNRSKYPATQFRNDSVVRYFDIWPEFENSTGVQFKYFCEDPGKGNLSLSNFTYSEFEGRLDPLPYFDLGIVEHSTQPYWKHWWFQKLDTNRISYPISCEYNDLHHLYVHRFWNKPMWQGFLAFLVMQGGVQSIVLVVMTLRWSWRLCQCANVQRRQLARNLLRGWFRFWGDWCSEALHLYIVAEVGYCMMEAVGRSDFRAWRATFLYNTGVMYTWLSLLAVVSSILRQIAYSWMEPRRLREYEDMRRQNNPNRRGGLWFALQGISDDWRWQRVFGQLGVLLLLGAYLTFVDPSAGGGMDQIAGLVLAATVVACIWSYGVLAVVFSGLFCTFVLKPSALATCEDLQGFGKDLQASEKPWEQIYILG